MKRVFLVMLLGCCSLNAWSLGRLAGVEILDRDTGETLPVYRHHGEYWVAGNPGSRYAVVITNQRGERLLAVTSVDGVNVISGETAAWNQTGYVFRPGERYSIDGWRKSNQEVADFNFTALPNSYAALTGRPDNVGVIGVAVFLEKRPAVARYSPQWVAPPSVPAERESAARVMGGAAPPAAAESRAAGDAVARTQTSPARSSPVPANAASASPAPANAPPAYAARAATDAASLESDRLAASRLGTGHGAREVSYVSDTEFERLSETPNEIIRIRYDRFDNLVAMGIARARPVPVTPSAFPESGASRFVPDPPGGE
jgi:hypothetical protein